MSLLVVVSILENIEDSSAISLLDSKVSMLIQNAINIWLRKILFIVAFFSCEKEIISFNFSINFAAPEEEERLRRDPPAIAVQRACFHAVAGDRRIVGDVALQIL